MFKKVFVVAIPVRVNDGIGEACGTVVVVGALTGPARIVTSGAKCFA